MKNIGFSKLLPKGSVLVFSLIILSLMLVTSLTLLSSSVSQERSALSSGDSTRAFQVANTGNEKVLYQLYKIRPATIDVIASNLGLSCSGGIITSSDGWTVRFFDESESRITDCGDTGRIASIKSDGNSQNTTRAVQVAVAATGLASSLSCSMPSGGSSPICCKETSTGDVQCAYYNSGSWHKFTSGNTTWPW